MGLFTGHMLPSFQNLTAPIMLIARARTDKRNAASSLLMRFTPFLKIGQIEVAGCDVHVVHVEYLLLAMLHKPAFNFFTDITGIVKKIDFLLCNEYLDNEN